MPSNQKQLLLRVLDAEKWVCDHCVINLDEQLELLRSISAHKSRQLALLQQVYDEMITYRHEVEMLALRPIFDATWDLHVQIGTQDHLDNPKFALASTDDPYILRFTATANGHTIRLVDDIALGRDIATRHINDVIRRLQKAFYQILENEGVDFQYWFRGCFDPIIIKSENVKKIRNNVALALFHSDFYKIFYSDNKTGIRIKWAAIEEKQSDEERQVINGYYNSCVSTYVGNNQMNTASELELCAMRSNNALPKALPKEGAFLKDVITIGTEQPTQKGEWLKTLVDDIKMYSGGKFAKHDALYSAFFTKDNLNNKQMKVRLEELVGMKINDDIIHKMKLSASYCSANGTRNYKPWWYWALALIRLLKQKPESGQEPKSCLEDKGFNANDFTGLGDVGENLFKEKLEGLRKLDISNMHLSKAKIALAIVYLFCREALEQGSDWCKFFFLKAIQAGAYNSVLGKHELTQESFFQKLT